MLTGGAVSLIVSALGYKLLGPHMGGSRRKLKTKFQDFFRITFIQFPELLATFHAEQKEAITKIDYADK